MIFFRVYAILWGMKQSYGERLATALRFKNLKQADLANELGITQATVSKIINGSQYLDFDLAVKACRILDISLSQLAYGVEQDSNSRFFRNPERQRIEYLLSIINEAEYPLLIVALEELIEIRFKDEKPESAEKPRTSGTPGSRKKKK